MSAGCGGEPYRGNQVCVVFTNSHWSSAAGKLGLYSLGSTPRITDPKPIRSP